MRSPLSRLGPSSEREEVIAAFGSLLRSEREPVERNGTENHDGGPPAELSQTLLYGLPTAAAYLGLSAPQLRTWLEYGGPLPTIARAQGRQTETVVDIFVENAIANLEPLVVVGWLEQEQCDALLTELGRRLDTTGWDVAGSGLAA